MSSLEISVAHNNARLQATANYADSGSGPSRIRLYDAADTLLATMVLTKPCGTIVADKLVLTQAEPTSDQVLQQGSAARGEWVTSNGALVGRGAVTDATGDGPFKVSGTTGTMLYAGAFAILGPVALE